MNGAIEYSESEKAFAPETSEPNETIGKTQTSKTVETS